MTAMRRVTMLMPETLWNEMAIAAGVRSQTRGEFARGILERETDITLYQAGMRKKVSGPTPAPAVGETPDE